MSTDQVGGRAPRPKQSSSEPSKYSSAGRNAGKNDEDKLAKLEKEIEGLKVQNGILREGFDFKRVRESFQLADNDLLEILIEQNKQLQGRVKELESASNNNDSLIAELMKKADEIGKLSTKLRETESLSKVVGAQITDGNPDIADLSGLNRPTKLAERYAELYDNEWTDAFEEIEGSGTKEVEVIKRLLETLKDVYKFCQNVSKEYEKSIMTSALVFPGRPKTPQLTAISRKQIMELKNTCALSLTEDVFKQYIKTLKQPLDRSPKTKLFVKTCVEICWLMSIKDPPVVLDIGDPKGPFDGDKYRIYTRSGKSFDYIVWPPMRLHDAGPLLGKGVAQAK